MEQYADTAATFLGFDRKTVPGNITTLEHLITGTQDSNILTLAPGESRRVELTIGPKQLRTLGPDYVWRVEPGIFELQLGDNAENILLRADLTVE